VLIVLADADESNVYPELLFLGTGSAMPNRVRNVSAILLNLRYAAVTPVDAIFAYDRIFPGFPCSHF